MLAAVVMQQLAILKGQPNLVKIIWEKLTQIATEEPQHLSFISLLLQHEQGRQFLIANIAALSTVLNKKML